MKICYPKDGLIHKPFLFFLLIFFGLQGYTQVFPARQYPKGYFIYPVDAKIGLAANFGELRPNHYHMGLDCRTDQVENKTVKAAADGYVAHVRVEPFGFGQAIYVNHPNGLTTLYGHVNEFFPALEEYVKQQQYKLKSWKVFLDIPPGMFPVRQGQFIAKSGNRGGSQGPHCHFEIRDTKTDKVLNPLLFGFPIPDNVPPTLVRLAMYDRCLSTYSQSPKLFGLKKVSDGYTTTTGVISVNTDKISFGISANDKVSGSSNPNGIYEAILSLDNKPIVGFRLDSIGYDETRYLNAHIDYRTRAAGGSYIQHICRLPGYPEGVYKDISGDGVIELTDNEIHEVEIMVRDTYGNTSALNFKIKKGIIKETGKSGDTLYHQQKEFHPGFVNIFESEDLQVILSPEDLYDSVSFTQSEKAVTYPNSYSGLHSVESALVPVHTYYTIRIRANKEVPEVLQERMLMKRTWGGKTDIVKTSRNDDWYTGSFREFGNFELIADDDPPLISGGFADNADLSKSSRIIFIPRDNNDDIKSFTAMLDGNWLRFTNDKGRSFIYNFDEMCSRGKHELVITVEDIAGNTSQKTLHFTR
ncbi:MAG: peptidoglycan DD-metalloendopeptidase family protein [Ginsengibacter sp.]